VLDAYRHAVILGVHFVRHEFSRVSFDWSVNPCARTPTELGLRSVGHRCRVSGARVVSLSARAIEQSLRRKNSASLAACSRMGRTSRSTGARSCVELDRRISLSRANLELDVRCGHFFHSGARSHTQTPSKTPRVSQW